MSGQTLVLLHHSGGTARVFDRLRHALPPEVAPVALELPGRGRRWREPPVTTAPDAVADLAGQLAAAGVTGRFALLGHSMGAYLGLALAARLESGVAGRPDGGPRCERIFASANAAPARAAPILGGAPEAASDEAILGEATRFGGLAPQVLAHEQLRQRAAELLRADLRVCDSFVRTLRHTVIRSPLVVCHGTSDVFTGEELTAWRESTTAATTFAAFPGGHFYLDGDAAVPLAELVASHLAGPPSAGVAGDGPGAPAAARPGRAEPPRPA